MPRTIDHCEYLHFPPEGVQMLRHDREVLVNKHLLVPAIGNLRTNYLTYCTITVNVEFRFEETYPH